MAHVVLVLVDGELGASRTDMALRVPIRRRWASRRRPCRRALGSPRLDGMADVAAGPMIR